MDIAVIGLPSSGKSSLFSLLTGAGPRNGRNGSSDGVAKVPDARIEFLSGLFKPAKTTHAQVNLIDYPGYSPATCRATAKNADAILLVTGVYACGAAGDSRTAASEFDDIMTDLVLGDLQQVEGTLERLANGRGKPKQDKDVEVLERLKAALEDGVPASAADLDRDGRTRVKSYGLTTSKPIVVAVNLSEDQVSSGDYPGKKDLPTRCSGMGAEMVEFSCMIEKEVAQLPPDEQQAFLSAYGLREPGIHRLARAVYRSAGLISFFTCGEDEVRAWPVRAGATAREAAGKIHSDIERGFIRAEVFSFDDIKELGSVRAVKEAGKFRLESRDYVVKDGDVCSFRFNV